MKCYRIKDQFGIDALCLDDVDDPRPKSRQVLVRMKACSLNYRDLLVIKGLYNPKLRRPMIPFSDGVGEVVEVSPDVTRVKPGDRVAGIFMQDWLAGTVTEAAGKSALGGAIDGVLAERVVFHEEGLVPVPTQLTDEEAATLPCAAVTAWHALMGEGGVKPGDSILIQGTGGVSIFALQFARLAGARVIATSSSDAKLERANKLGASDGINYKSNPDWDKTVRELTNNTGVDQVIEVGGAGTLPRSLKAVRMGGKISLIGILSGGSEFNPLPILMKNVRVQGIFVGSRAMFEAMNRAISLHQLRPVVDRVFPFQEVKEALKYMERGDHFGKIAIRI